MNWTVALGPVFYQKKNYIEHEPTADEVCPLRGSSAINISRKFAIYMEFWNYSALNFDLSPHIAKELNNDMV